ncbi:LptF/LptG family permease [Pontiella agarivorans]|uniref:LptF/LptG family permease n=1 Tax=Pontiella agarivorans TaxID=3038953 RepID=A0ABU5N1U4_9BACT|nr:LptF/LptG family permease [Pontiella agarivorans]MDZ8120418.1 LptF/LptG family permease [Pontiella agarivorans]
MRKLTKYLLSDFLTIFGTALLLITFAFSIGTMYKLIDYMAKGLPLSVIGQFAVYTLPYSLSFTIPISALFSTLLLFGRLSSDSELAAMRGGGLSLFQISSPIILFSMLLSIICFYNSFTIYPKTTFAAERLKKNALSMGVEDPIKLLEEGRFIRDFPGYMIYVGKKYRNKVRDLVVYKTDRTSGEITDTLRADSGILTIDEEKMVLKIDLFDVRMEIADAEEPGKIHYMSARKHPIRVDLNDLTKKSSVRKKRKYLNFRELVYVLRNPEADMGWMRKYDMQVEHGRDLIEFHQRICLAIAPLMFVLVAIPLGITSHRKESSIGMLMSLAVMFIYYIFIILSDTFDKKPQYYPWLLPWIPIVLGQIYGLFMIRRAD